MIEHNLPKWTSSYVLTESFEQIWISSRTLEFILCDIKYVSYIFIFAVALNFLSNSSCSFLIDPIFLLSQYSFSSFHALCSVAPSWKDCLSLISPFDIFKKTFQCDVTQDSKEMEQLINLYQKEKNPKTLMYSYIPFILFNLFNTQIISCLKAPIMECCSRCPDSL